MGNNNLRKRRDYEVEVVTSPMQDQANWYRVPGSAFKPSLTTPEVDNVEFQAYMDYINSRIYVTEYDEPPVFLTEVNNDLALSVHEIKIKTLHLEISSTNPAELREIDKKIEEQKNELNLALKK